MKTTKLIAFLSSLVMLNVAATVQAQPVKDIPGWSDTRWGMKPDELRKAHPEMDEARPYRQWPSSSGKSLEQITQQLAEMNEENGECHTSAEAPTWTLADLTISGGSFKVCVQFRGDRLKRVELIGPQTTCYSIAETLTAKYGQPSEKSSGFHLWLMPTTTIRLIDNDQMGNIHCEVIYHETEHNEAL